MEAARFAASDLPIVFHGFQADCGPFFRAADLLVFPSHPDLEGQGQVPFEAMAHGLPCLISDIDVAMETADNGACAEVFSRGNCMELALKIKRLQTDPERLRELREKGLARFLSTYTIDSIRDLYFHLFDQILLRGDR
jgi:glycosyltransferase involved in cell wall biosynthesis